MSATVETALVFAFPCPGQFQNLGNIRGGFVGGVAKDHPKRRDSGGKLEIVAGPG